MSELRIRGVDDDIVEGLKKVAEDNGRSLESELRIRLYEIARAKLADFPTSTDWRQAGFDELFELVTGRQYIAAAAGGQSFRITLMESKLGSSISWQTEIEESFRGSDGLFWRRAINVAQRLNGDTAAVAMRDCIRWLAEYAGVDAISRLRREAEALQTFPKAYRRVIDDISKTLYGATREVRERSVVIFRTSSYEIYLNLINHSIAVMVYRHGQTWSITNGTASHFELKESAAQEIIRSLAEMSVLPSTNASEKAAKLSRPQ